MFIYNCYANNNKKVLMTLKQRHLLIDTVLRCHGNMPADDNEEIISLPSPSAFQTAT